MGKGLKYYKNASLRNTLIYFYYQNLVVNERNFVIGVSMRYQFLLVYKDLLNIRKKNYQVQRKYLLNFKNSQENCIQ